MKPIETMDELKEVLDELNVKYSFGNVHYSFGNVSYTIMFKTKTAGQAVVAQGFAENLKGVIKEITDYAKNYDVNEVVSSYANFLGERGIPDNYETLVDSIKEAKETLIKIADRLNEGVAETGKEKKKLKDCGWILLNIKKEKKIWKPYAIIERE